MLLSSNENLTGGGLLLEMALQAEHLIAFGKHPRIDRAMRLMAGGAPFTHGFVFEDERPALRDVAFAAGLLFGTEGGSTTYDGLTLVWIVTIAATDLCLASKSPAMGSFQNWMRVGQAELPALI